MGNSDTIAASIDNYLNATVFQSISAIHFEEIAMKHVFMITFPKKVVMVDLYDMGIYMLVLHTTDYIMFNVSFFTASNYNEIERILGSLLSKIGLYFRYCAL